MFIPFLSWDAVPLWGWTIIMTGLALNRPVVDGALFANVFRHAVESPAATYLGSRSYSVYLCHVPIIAICHSFWLGLFPTAMRVSTFFGVSAMVVPLTLIAAELLYRGVEQPRIALGSRLARRLQRASSPGGKRSRANAAPV
jgi:peptidoglycan/LPS O-acetylase OafA/YrhL